MRERKRLGSDFILSASDWNSFLETSERVLSGRLNRRDDTLSVQRGNQDVLGKNMAGEDLPAFSIVGLSLTIVPTPDNFQEFRQQNHIFEIVRPVLPDHLGRWGVTQEPIKEDSTGRVRIAGIAIAKVTGTAPDGGDTTFAECQDDDIENLTTKRRGMAQVLWRDDELDWAVIRMGNGYGPTVIKGVLTSGNTFDQATLTGTHTAGSIAGVDAIWNGDDEVDVENPYLVKLWDGGVVRAEWNVTDEEWQITNCNGDKVVHGNRLNVAETDYEKLDGASGWSSWLEVTSECPE